MDVNSIALEAAKFVTADSSVKRDILAKYSIMADVIYGGAGIDIIKNNIDAFKGLMAVNVIRWVMLEKNSDIYNNTKNINNKIDRLFIDEKNASGEIAKIANKVGLSLQDVAKYSDVQLGLKTFGIEEIDESDDNDMLDIIDDMDNYGDDADDTIDVDDIVKSESIDLKDSNTSGYIEKIHGGYRKQIEDVLLSVWEELYSYHIDGKEVINGFIIPGNSLLGTGETTRYEGLLTLRDDIVEIKPNTMSNAIYEEFVESCKDCGIPIIKEVAQEEKDVKAYKYNPMLQRSIVGGKINSKAYVKGWKEYRASLEPYIREKTEELAVIKVNSSSDEQIYKELSGYTIALVAVDYKEGLGTLLKVCCGDTSKTGRVAKRLVNRLRERERTHKSIAQGKMIVSTPIISETGLTASISIYINIAGYYAIPRFMGELLVNIKEGLFKPSIDKMIIGIDLKNNMVTAPFTKWLIPILAGSRSGKGVLTLSMLLNVIGCELPLFYLDGKPDMAALLWKLQDKYNIEKSIVVDGINYQGVTEVDRKQFVAPYYNNIIKMMNSETSNELLEANFGVMIYLKTMMVILLSTRYYKDKMKSCYGELFVVFDEMFKIMKTQVETLVLNIDMAMAKLGREERDKKQELIKIKTWVTELLQTYIGNDIGVFGGGIKAVALSQFAQDSQYNVSGLTTAKTFCTNFLLKRGVKIFGRQEGGSGIYGVTRDRGDDIKFELYDKYYHFGIGSEQGNNYNNLRTFKPLLVLNENDCKELTGEQVDGAFTADMVGRISRYTDIDEFRRTYFENEEIARSLGFEGALEQIGRIMGKDWREMLSNSLGRAYDIADEALRYYKVVGANGISSVHDYICSFDVSHLWSYNEIIRAKTKGAYLDGKEDEAKSMFENMRQYENEVIDLDERVETEDDELEGYERLSDEIEDTVINTNKAGFSDEENAIFNEIEHRKRVNARPIEDTAHNGENIIKVQGRDKRDIIINAGNASKLNEKNCVDVELDEYSTSRKFERVLFKNMRGANIEFKRRWDAVIKAVADRFGKDVVTRMVITKDAVYVNGRYVNLNKIIGGFTNIRIEDIVKLKPVLKKFRYLNEITIDSVILERVAVEYRDVPNDIFEGSKNLNKIGIVNERGQKEVIKRSNVEKSRAVEEAVLSNKYKAVCSSKNPKYKSTSVGERNKVWNATKQFTGNGWKSVQKQLSKSNPSLIKAAGIGVITGGVLIVGGGISLIARAARGIAGLFGMFK